MMLLSMEMTLATLPAVALSFVVGFQFKKLRREMQELREKVEALEAKQSSENKSS